MIICSISKLTIAAGSSPSWSTGVFIRNSPPSLSRVTFHKSAMPPLCNSSSTRNPSMTVPISSLTFAT